MMTLATVRAALMADGVDDNTINLFFDNFLECPEVWQHFERITLDLIQRGKRAGAKAVWEKVRWEIAVEGGKDFKANNNFCSYYARAFELKHPQYRGFFEKRKVRGLQAA